MLFTKVIFMKPITTRHFFYKKLVITALSILVSYSLFSQINITTNQLDGTYEIGEQINFEVTSTTGGSVSWVLKYDDFAPIISSGTFNINPNQTEVISHTATEEGVIICEITKSGVTEIAAAAIEPFKVLPFENEPSDFDSFWTNQKADLAAVSMNPNLTFYSNNDYSTTYRVELDNIDNRKVYGYLTVPDGPGPFPAVIILPPYGSVANITTPEVILAQTGGMLSFSVSIHNVAPDLMDPLAYIPDNYDDRDEYYYKFGMLGAVRAIDYLFSRSDFDGSNLAVVGVSQGAGLAINVAGLDDRVKLLAFSNPTLSQNAGLYHGKAGGFPNYIHRSQVEFGTTAHELATLNASRYYDAMFFARRYQGPTLACLSYEDLITPSATGFATFNQLGTPKILLHALELDHSHPEEYWVGRYDFFRRFFPSTLNTASFPYAPSTQGYLIDAGDDLVIQGNNTSLSGIIEKDNVVNGSNLNPFWKKKSGPGTVSFSNPNNYNSTATFSQTGTYVLEFTGVDNAMLNTDKKYFSLFDEITITVQDSGNDTTPPVAVLTTPSNSVNGDFIVTVDFSENINGLDLNDFIITNGVASQFSGTGSLYSFTVAPINIGDVTILLPNNTVVDIAGNPNVGDSNLLTINYSNDGDCSNPTNIALNKISTQHSTQFNAEASRANDGNTNGDFWGGNSTSLTNWTSNSWWEVDLGSVSDITEINIWNRTDCCQSILQNYYVFVSDNPFTSTNLNTTINQVGVNSFFETTIAGAPTTININETGRFVRVQLAGSGFLGLAEVEVMGCAGSGGTPLDQTISFPAIPNKLTTDNPFVLNATSNSGLPVSYTIVSGPATIVGDIITLTGISGVVVVEGNQVGNAQYNPAPTVSQSFTVTEPIPSNCTSTTNLGLGKIATQSGTQVNAEASRAIDGNTSGNFWGDNSCSLTNWLSNPWWEVDLAAISDIESINLWNRTDCCSDLFSDVYIFISEVPFASSDLNTTLNQSGVSNYFIAGEIDVPTTITINQTGRYVRVQLLGTSYLAISEVEIIGCVNGNGCPSAGTICDDNDPSTFNDVEDGNCNCIGTSCPTAGTICDDGNPNTENDIENGFCICAGTPIGGGCSSPTNLALNQPTNQSTTLSLPTIIGSSEKAVDGNQNGIFFTGNPSASSVSATAYGPEEWWEVDLGDNYLIEEINVYNRTDGQDKSKDVYVLISENPFTASSLSDARNEASYEYFIAGDVGSPSVIQLNTNGRYVRIQRSTSGFLVLAEVEVFGCVVNNSNPPLTIISTQVDVLQFDITKQLREVKLLWATNTEFKNEYFILEKSSDGITFETLMEVNSQSDLSEIAVYDRKDSEPFFGKNYYRLVQVFNDGNKIYSPIRLVDFDFDLNQLQIFPNPASEKVHINLQPYLGENMSIQIFDARGVLMEEKNIYQLVENIQTFELDDYTNGLYLFAIQVQGQKLITKPFVVSRDY